MIIIQSNIVKIISFGFAQAITIFPFIIMKNKDKEIILNHEKIHYKQQKELLIIGFFLLYLLEYLIRIIQYKSFNQAYYNISFERECFDNQIYYNYLQHRKMFSFLKYIKENGIYR